MIKKIINIYQTQDSIVFWFTCTSVLLSLLVVFLWAYQYPNLPSQLPLFYSLTWGEKQLVSLNQFVLLPGIILIITVVNLLISWHLHSSQLLLKRMLSINSALIALLVTVVAIKIIYTFI